MKLKFNDGYYDPRTKSVVGSRTDAVFSRHEARHAEQDSLGLLSAYQFYVESALIALCFFGLVTSSPFVFVIAGLGVLFNLALEIDAIVYSKRV